MEIYGCLSELHDFVENRLGVDRLVDYTCRLRSLGLWGREVIKVAHPDMAAKLQYVAASALSLEELEHRQGDVFARDWELLHAGDTTCHQAHVTIDKVDVLMNHPDFRCHGEARLLDPNEEILNVLLPHTQGRMNGFVEYFMEERIRHFKQREERFVILLFSHLIPCTDPNHMCSKLLTEYVNRTGNFVIVGYDNLYEMTNMVESLRNLEHKNIYVVKRQFLKKQIAESKLSDEQVITEARDVAVYHDQQRRQAEWEARFTYSLNSQLGEFACGIPYEKSWVYPGDSFECYASDYDSRKIRQERRMHDRSRHQEQIPYHRRPKNNNNRVRSQADARTELEELKQSNGYNSHHDNYNKRESSKTYFQRQYMSDNSHNDDFEFRFDCERAGPDSLYLLEDALDQYSTQPYRSRSWLQEGRQDADWQSHHSENYENDYDCDSYINNAIDYWNIDQLRNRAYNYPFKSGKPSFSDNYDTKPVTNIDCHVLPSDSYEDVNILCDRKFRAENEQFKRSSPSERHSVRRDGRQPEATRGVRHKRRRDLVREKRSDFRQRRGWYFRYSPPVETRWKPSYSRQAKRYKHFR